MEHLNQKCFSPQNLSCSYHRLTSMQMGLVVICSSSISHNFGLEDPIPTIQAFLYSLQWALSHGTLKYLSTQIFIIVQWINESH